MTETRQKRAQQVGHDHPLELELDVGSGSCGSRSQCVFYVPLASQPRGGILLRA